MPSPSCGRGLSALLRNLAIAALLYTLAYGLISLVHSPTAATTRLKGNKFMNKLLPSQLQADEVKTVDSNTLRVTFAGHKQTVTLNPHANVFNRPSSAVSPRDDYLGTRPHVDTEANIDLLVEECRGTYEGIEKMRDVFSCLQFLANDEHRYYHLPATADRQSAQNPQEAEYLNADGHENTLSKYPSVASAAAASKDSIGTCPGPIVPYHTYWTGPATWRVEIFIKSYLATQNLACSRLYIWLDADRNPSAVDDMLHRDALFARFLPLVERGDITLKAWHFPSRIPLPKQEDNTDGVGYYTHPGKPNSQGEVAVADGIVEDPNGQQWLVLTPKQMTFLPVAVSDAVRFVVLHLYGGSYYDMDVLMLRDMRPLLIGRHKHNFAERWAAHPHPGDYNTAIMSLTANSSLSSYLLRGGVRMGLNFHPRVIGRMAWKDGRDQEFKMIETAAFDPIWTEFNRDREGRCTVPCFKDYSAPFKGRQGILREEWESYDGELLPLLEGGKTKRSAEELVDVTARTIERRERQRRAVIAQHPGGYIGEDIAQIDIETMREPLQSFAPSDDEEAELRRLGVVSDYRLAEDKYPPNNRTLENFFRGAWTYHVHNQWHKHPEPSSWFDILQQAHDGFLAGQRSNVYGEKWRGPTVLRYNKWPDQV